jgi:hypothetical protein
MSDTATFPSTTGDSQHGVTVNYGACLFSPILVLTINVQTYGTTPECCCYPLAPNPDALSGAIEVVDCADQTQYLAGGHGSFVNGDFCAGNDGACDCDATLPVEPTTWGQIKALYTGVR